MFISFLNPLVFWLNFTFTITTINVFSRKQIVHLTVYSPIKRIDIWHTSQRENVFFTLNKQTSAL